MSLTPEQNVFGQDLLTILLGETGHEIVERESGCIQVNPGGPRIYFATFE